MRSLAWVGRVIVDPSDQSKSCEFRMGSHKDTKTRRGFPFGMRVEAPGLYAVSTPRHSGSGSSAQCILAWVRRGHSGSKRSKFAPVISRGGFARCYSELGSWRDFGGLGRRRLRRGCGRHGLSGRIGGGRRSFRSSWGFSTGVVVRFRVGGVLRFGRGRRRAERRDRRPERRVVGGAGPGGG